MTGDGLMDCNVFNENVDAYLDNELSYEDSKAIEQHAVKCKICNDMLKNRRKILNEIRGAIAEIEVPDEFHQGWVNEVSKIKAQRKQKRLWATVSACAAAFVCLVGAVALMNSPNLSTQAKDNVVNEISKVDSQQAKISVSAGTDSSKLSSQSATNEIISGEAYNVQAQDLPMMSYDSSESRSIDQYAGNYELKIFTNDVSRTKGELMEIVKENGTKYECESDEALIVLGDENNISPLKDWALCYGSEWKDKIESKYLIISIVQQ